MQRNYNLKEIQVELIEANPYQPRQQFDDEMILDLSESIKLYGVVQPITVRKKNNKKYELIAGERRLRAAKKAGLKKIPVIINQVTDKESAVIALVENIQRENLNYIEEAEAFKKLSDTYGFTQKEVADRVGKSQSTIANKLRLLKLSDNVRNELKYNALTERHARSLLKLENEEEQVNAIKEIVEKKLNVKKTEQLIDKINNKEDLNNTKSFTVKKAYKDTRIINNTIMQAVKMLEGTGLEVDYKAKEIDNIYKINITIPLK